MNTVFELDPDFRRSPPRNADGSTAPCCARCQKRVEPATTRKAWVNWESLKVSTSRDAVAGNSHSSEITEEYIGADCWKNIGLLIT